MGSRGRPKLIEEKPTPIIFNKIYNNGKEKHIWFYNKNITSRGPISIEIFDDQYNDSDKLIREIDNLEKKYLQKNGERKPRMLKKDKELLEKLKNNLENEHYKYYPEDRPNVRKTKTYKTSKKKV